MLKLMDYGACPGPRSGVRQNDEKTEKMTFYGTINLNANLMGLSGYAYIVDE
jgi:hypothetical protein